MNPEIEANHRKELDQLHVFGDHYGYDVAYLEEMLRLSPAAFRVFAGAGQMAGFREQAPRDAYFVAKLAAYRQVDCGPCLQLAIRMAQEAGVSDEIIAAAAMIDGALNESLERARQFALACLGVRDDVDALRKELEWEFGKAAIVEMGIAIAAAQIFPVVKRAMGHYQSCSMVTIEL